MGLFVQCLYVLSLHLVSVVFGTAIPTSLNIFGKCFIDLFVSFFAVQYVVHHRGWCSSSALLSGTKKQIYDDRQLLLCVRGWE